MIDVNVIKETNEERNRYNSLTYFSLVSLPMSYQNFYPSCSNDECKGDSGSPPRAYPPRRITNMRHITRGTMMRRVTRNT